MDYDCGKLLDSLRPQAENDLQACAGFFSPDKIGTCQSQSFRAIKALECINTFLDVQRTLGVMAFNEHVQNWIQMRERLRDFLAVHRTVVLCEHDASKRHGQQFEEARALAEVRAS